MFLRQWARKELQPGDMSALEQLRRQWNDPSPARAERLLRRGFVTRRGGKLQVTVKGRDLPGRSRRRRAPSHSLDRTAREKRSFPSSIALHSQQASNRLE